MEQIKAFFGITSDRFELETFDITTVLTIACVVSIFIGWKYASIFGVISCVVCLIWNIKHHAHINSYITQFVLIAMNIKFLM